MNESARAVSRGSAVGTEAMQLGVGSNSLGYLRDELGKLETFFLRAVSYCIMRSSRKLRY